MKKKILVTFGILLLALTAYGQKKYPQGIEHVVIIGIDGMSTQGLLEASTPCMDSLMREGAYAYDVRCVLPTVSAPNWAAMLNGAGPEATGVLGNGWRRDQWDLPAVARTKNRIFPNIFTVLHEQKPDFETGALYQWGGFVHFLETEILNRYEQHSSQLETAQKTAEYIVEKKPNFLFIQLDDVDGAGHNQGHMSAPYLKKIEETDGHIRLIVNAIKTAGIAGKTLIMVVSDHGGISYGHGGNTYEELTTPIIFSGKGIKKNYHIRQQIYQYDVAATVAFAFGLKQPQPWTGRPVIAAFEGFDEPENLWEGGITIYTIGDSTMANKDTTNGNPERGWAMAFQPFFDAGKVVVENHAMNGRSTKSFIDEGRWKVITDKLKKGDYVFIQFGHNDEKIEDPTRYADAQGAYKVNLARFVAETRAKKANPVLMTPIIRRRFDNNGVLVNTHDDYPDAVRALAEALNVPLIDMEKKTRHLIQSMGPEDSKSLFMWFPAGHSAAHPNGITDDTHLNGRGACLVAKEAVKGIRELNLPLAGYLTEKDYNLVNYGAKPDGKTLNTKAIQAAIDDLDDVEVSQGGVLVAADSESHVLTPGDILIHFWKTK